MLKPRVREKDSELSYSVPPGLAPWGNGNGGFASLEDFKQFRDTSRPAQLRGYDKLLRERMTDWITPGFRDIVKKGEFRPINPMSKVLSEQPAAVVDYWSSFVGPRTDHTGYKYFQGMFEASRYAFDLAPAGSIADDADINAMLLDAKASLKSAGMDYLTSAAEFRETLGMFLNMKENLLNRRDSAVEAWSKDLAKRRRTGKFSGFHSLKEGWEAFSNFWLEYRFGWRILAYDIQAIIDYYKRKDDGTVLFTRRVTNEFTDSQKRLVLTKNFGQFGFLEFWEHSDVTETVRVGFSAFVDQAVLGNPIALNTLYDITPWTLVVDMFFNVQDNIIALSRFPIGVNEVSDSGFVSSKIKQSSTIFPVYVPGTLPVSEKIVHIQPLNVAMAESYTRGKINEPSFDISFQPNLDFGKLIDLATLAMPIFRIIRKYLK